MTQAEAQALRDAWYAALLAVATGQSYTIGNRTLTRVDAAEVRAQFERAEADLAAIIAGRARGPFTVRAIPRDL